MNVNSLRLTLASAPALALFRGSPEVSARQGTILFYHGFGVAKETSTTILSSLAEAGFLALGIDGIGHGERRYPDFDARFPPFEPRFKGNTQLEAAFLHVVQQTVGEVPRILDTLIARRWAYPDRIGMSGLSFGGMITYAAVVADKRIGAAAPVVGSPEWKLSWPDSPHLHLDSFYPTALLSQTAGQDTNMLPGQVREFHRRLAPYYASAPERLRFLEYPNSPHHLTEEDWIQVWKTVVEWFRTSLSFR